ncbi:ROK family protein [Cytobacillus gottheilii]|uniref:ROK family protein n=1 Tax=Cytobacillus gottheilii TaxID=859144 RepID=UPI0009EE1BB4|nr:ROK family protein [Cytobacillus gottheilii]
MYAAFDIGGTEVKYAMLSMDGDFLHRGSFLTERDNGQLILNQMLDVLSQYKELTGIAISAPGFVNAYTGFIEKGGAITDFDGFNMKDYLEEKTGLPVTVENDVNCVALAEKWQGKAKKLEHFLCLTIGTGIGGAMVLDNKLYRGASFAAGEFGYMITHGLQGGSIDKSTLSSTASVYGLRKRYADIKGISMKDITGVEIFEAADQGDEDAISEIESFYDHLSTGLYNLYFMFNPEKILIGGGISSRTELLEEVRQRVYKLNDYIDGNIIDICHFKNEAGLIGALYHHLEQYKTEKKDETVWKG